MSQTKLSRVVERLDRLDGKINGLYAGLSLHLRNATGICEVMETVETSLGTNKVIAEMSTPLSGGNVKINCKILTDRLDIFSQFAERNPATQFIAQLKNRTANFSNLPTPEQLFVDRVVDHLISALLLGVATTDESLGKMFSHVPLDTTIQTVRNTGGLIGIEGAKYFYVQDTHEAYQIFTKFGKRYNLDTRLFRPNEIKKASPKEEFSPGPDPVLRVKKPKSI